MQAKTSDEKKIKLQELVFYFAAQEKDRMDSGSLNRKSGQVLALREKLLSMPEGEFESTIKTIERLVTSSPKSEETDSRNMKRSASELFERVKNQHIGTEKISKV